MILWGKTLYIILSVSVLSVLANMKNTLSVFYRYRTIKRLSLSGFIGIGRYKKKLIGRTLYEYILYTKCEGQQNTYK